MSATPIRRRAVRAVLAGAVSLVLLAGCTTTQRDASNYKDTEDDFLEGCITRATEDNADGAEVQIASPEDWCQCAFDAIEDEIEFDRFKEVNSDLRDNGGPLPDDIQAAYDSCDPDVAADS